MLFPVVAVEFFRHNQSLTHLLKDERGVSDLFTNLDISSARREWQEKGLALW